MVTRGKWLLLSLIALAGVLGCPPKPAPTDIGCSTFENSRQVDLCDRIRQNLEWKRGGHATPFGAPHWQCTDQTVAKVVCSKPEIRIEDVSAAHAVVVKRKEQTSLVDGCLLGIEDAIQGRALPKSDPGAQRAVFRSPDD